MLSSPHLLSPVSRLPEEVSSSVRPDESFCSRFRPGGNKACFRRSVPVRIAFPSRRERSPPPENLRLPDERERTHSSADPLPVSPRLRVGSGLDEGPARTREVRRTRVGARGARSESAGLPRPDGGRHARDGGAGDRCPGRAGGARRLEPRRVPRRARREPHAARRGPGPSGARVRVALALEPQAGTRSARCVEATRRDARFTTTRATSVNLSRTGSSRRAPTIRSSRRSTVGLFSSITVASTRPFRSRSRSASPSGRATSTSSLSMTATTCTRACPGFSTD